MELTCDRCGEDFDSSIARGYCDDCVQAFHDMKRPVQEKQNPQEGVRLTGRFRSAENCPQSFTDPVDEDRRVCGLCGSDQLDLLGYGFAGGYGLGGYTFCFGCNSVLDFSEDKS